MPAGDSAESCVHSLSGSVPPVIAPAEAVGLGRSWRPSRRSSRRCRRTRSRRRRRRSCSQHSSGAPQAAPFAFSAAQCPPTSRRSPTCSRAPRCKTSCTPWRRTTYAPHDAVVAARQVPAPSQVLAGVYVEPSARFADAGGAGRPLAARAGAVALAVEAAARSRVLRTFVVGIGAGRDRHGRGRWSGRSWRSSRRWQPPPHASIAADAVDAEVAGAFVGRDAARAVRLLPARRCPSQSRSCSARSRCSKRTSSCTSSRCTRSCRTTRW